MTLRGRHQSDSKIEGHALHNLKRERALPKSFCNFSPPLSKTPGKAQKYIFSADRFRKWENHFSPTIRGKKFTTTVETLLSLGGPVASVVYTFLSGPMVMYALFPCFPNQMVHTIAFFLSDLRVGRQTKRGGVPRWCALSFFPGTAPESEKLALAAKLFQIS